MSFVLGVEPSKRRPFPIKTRVIWVPGIIRYIYKYITPFITCFFWAQLAGGENHGGMTHDPHGEDRVWYVFFFETTFHYTGWLIGILIMVYYNPYITGEYNPLYNLTNQGFFIAHMKGVDFDGKCK